MPERVSPGDVIARTVAEFYSEPREEWHEEAAAAVHGALARAGFVVVPSDGIDKLPRFIVVVQDREGWTQEKGHAAEPQMHEAVLLSDVRAFLAPYKTTDKGEAP